MPTPPGRNGTPDRQTIMRLRSLGSSSTRAPSSPSGMWTAWGARPTPPLLELADVDQHGVALVDRRAATSGVICSTLTGSSMLPAP